MEERRRMLMGAKGEAQVELTTLCLFHFDESTTKEEGYLPRYRNWNGSYYIWPIDQKDSVLETNTTYYVKFGEGSLNKSISFPGYITSGRYTTEGISIGENEDFTIDFWFYHNDNISRNDFLLSTKPQESGAYYSFSAGYSKYGNTWKTCLGGSFPDWSCYLYESDTLFTHSVTWGWHHVALVRHGRDHMVFYDGQILYNKDANSPAFRPYIILVGSAGDSSQYNRCYIDEFRICKGAAWTKNFTLPTEPYSGMNPLSLSSNSVTVGSASGTTSVVLYNNGVALTGVPSSEIEVAGAMLDSSSWDSTTGTVTLNYGGYQGYSTGRYPITISYGGYSVEFVLFKNPPVRLATDKDSVTVGDSAETVRLYVTNNNNTINNTSNVTYSGTYGSKSASGDGYIDISIPAYTGSGTRTWTATISYNDGYDSGSTTVTFSQSAATITNTVTTVENVSVTINHYMGNNNVMPPDGLNDLSTHNAPKWELYWYPYVSLNASYDIVNTYTWSNGTTTSETVSHKNISHNFSPQIYYTLEYKSAGNHDLVSTPKNWGQSWSDGQLVFDQSATVTRSMVNPSDNTVDITHEGWLYLLSTGATNMNANNAPSPYIGYGVPVAYRYTSSIHFTNSAPDTSSTMTMISKTVTS